MKNKKNLKIGRYLLLMLVIFFVWQIFYSPIKINFDMVIKKGDNFQTFVEKLPKTKQFSLKLYIYLHKDSLDLSKIQEGTYSFSGKYSKLEFLDVINDGPKQSFKRYTALEGRSIYDIDADLTKKGLINAGEYISFVSDPDIISKYIQRYDFLSYINKNIKSLEGFLYPDTYHLDLEGNLLDQLVYLQLENFNKRVWKALSDQIKSFSKLNWYDSMILATVVEKEERNKTNKSTVAGIFFNRLEKGMRLDADITLCYGLKEPYETCKPNVIARKISDKSNIYNTRQNYGMTPQPIANPSVDSILAVLNYKKTDYLYYLHDPDGNIHYGRTLEEHNSNKKNYLN